MEKLSVMSETIKTLAEKPAAAEWSSQMLTLKKSDQEYFGLPVIVERCAYISTC